MSFTKFSFSNNLLHSQKTINLVNFSEDSFSGPKKVLSACLGQVHFPFGQVIFHSVVPSGQVNV